MYDSLFIFSIKMGKVYSTPVLKALLLVAAAAAVRCFHLEGQSLWNDELFSFNVANLPLREIQPALTTYYHHPPLFFYLLHFVLRVFGNHAWALRLISAIGGSLTVGVVYIYAERFFGRRAGLIAGLLCLFAPFHLAYSQEGRPYALAALLALIGFYFLVEITLEQKKWHIVWYAVTSLALLHTHHWGIFVLASHLVFILVFAGASRDLKKKFGLVWLAVGVLYVPAALALFQQATTHSRAGWFWVDRPNPAEVVNLGFAFAGSYFKMASAVFDLPMVLKIVSGTAIMIFFLTSMKAVLGKSANVAMRGVVLCFGVSLALPFAVSFIRPEIFLWYRYSVIVFPVFCVCIGGVTMIERWKAVTIAAVAILILVGVFGTVRYYSWSKANVKDVAAYVGAAADDSVHIIIRPAYFAPLLNYYYKGDAAQFDEAYLDTPLGCVVDTARSFVYVSLDVPNVIRDYMDNHLVKTAGRSFPGEAHMGMVVGVYRQKPDLEQ